MDNFNFENLNGEEIWEKLYNKELNTKKNILEYIEMTGILIKEKVDIYQIESTYNFIYKKIDEMGTIIKPNTVMFLQNKLKEKLGKYVSLKDPKMQSTFIEFFKEAYPKGERRKDFTWVLLDINNISDEQIWTTLKYINRECLNEDLFLDDEEIEDIVKVIGKLVRNNNIKYINDIRSLSTLNSILKIKVIEDKGKFKVKRLEK
ncbi:MULTISPECIES: hypothetical protein [Clostridium]|nr:MULTISPECIES: hypothetical protein [Clostridium]MBO1686253.1 hypothetical protein [Clostridium butyricum]MDU1069942.1 hypothetical protein [Clostridium sp.]MDU1603173.1 hypothetical protein [Clostridium sp.]MDU2677754.1 hypothetical protein [Clostridium sp.]MDU2893874.1 hypothetical protein [Clostridium sp.]